MLHAGVDRCVTSVNYSYEGTRHDIHEIHIVEVHRWRVRRTVDGAEDIVDIDLRNAVNNKRFVDLPYPDGNVHNAYKEKFLSYAQFYINDKIDEIRISHYTGPFPKLIYLQEGQTETPASELVSNPGTIPSWIEVETPAEKAARERRENLLDWERTLHRIARKHKEADITKSLAEDYALIHNMGNPDTGLKTVIPTNNTHHRHADNAYRVSFIRKLLLGLGHRLIDLYRSPNRARPFNLLRATEWTLNKVYRVGDYEKLDGKTYFALQAHTATDANKPGVDKDTWKSVMLDNIPSSFTYDIVTYKRKADGEGYDRVITQRNVTIDIETGKGILEFIHCLTQELGHYEDYDWNYEYPRDLHPADYVPNDPIYYFHGVLKQIAEWRKKMIAWELWTCKQSDVDPTHIVPANKIYQGRPAHHHASQEEDTLDYAKQDWQDLWIRYNEALATHVQPESQSPFLRSPGMGG